VVAGGLPDTNEAVALGSGGADLALDAFHQRGPAADVVAAYLGEFLGLIPYQNRVNVAGAGVRREMRTLLVTSANRIFADGANPAYLFGSNPDQANPGLVVQTRRVKVNDPYGDMITLQLNHVTRAWAAVHETLMQKTRNTMGKALTRASAAGANNFNIALGISHM